MSNELDRVSAMLEHLVSAPQPCTCGPLTLSIPGYRLAAARHLRTMLERGGVSRHFPDRWDAEELARLVATLGGQARVEPVQQEPVLEPLLFHYGEEMTALVGLPPALQQVDHVDFHYTPLRTTE
jgi:hypothetical protein